MTDQQKKAKALKIAFFTLVGLIFTGTILFKMLEKDWNWIDSFYFTVVTVTTVGYGDLHPTSDSTRFAVAIFILIAVGIVGATISTLSGAFVKRRVEKKLNHN